MPWGSWINDLPTEFFMVVHIAAFAIGATSPGLRSSATSRFSAARSRCSPRPRSST